MSGSSNTDPQRPAEATRGTRGCLFLVALGLLVLLIISIPVYLARALVLVATWIKNNRLVALALLASWSLLITGTWLWFVSGASQLIDGELVTLDDKNTSLGAALIGGGVFALTVLAFERGLEATDRRREQREDRRNLQLTLANTPVLRGVDLGGEDLSAFFLVGKDLSGASLRGANLRGANLGHSNLSRSNLSQADLSGAHLIEADLTGADLTDAILNAADLTRAKLIEATLHATLMREADLTDADLTGAYLAHARLTGATLRGAILSDARLVAISLTGADLTNTMLTGADMSQAGLLMPDPEAWAGATYDRLTKWPHWYIDPPRAPRWGLLNRLD